MRVFLQSLLLLAIATVLAVVANLVAAPARRLALPSGFYPNALRVPPRDPVRVPPPPITETAALTTTATPTDTSVTMVPVPAAQPVAQPAAPPAVPLTETTASKPVPQAAATPPVAAPPQPAAKPLARFQPHPDKAYIEISGEDAAALYAGGALFLDARRTAAYEEGHIAGARPYSVWEADVDDKVNALYAERQDTQDQPIVIYCTGGACEDSHMLSQKLWGLQFNNVYVYKDGFPDWQKRGGAVRTGSKP